MTDPFATLGVPRDATDDQIKSAFRKLAMQYHPDRNPGDKAAEEKFKEINAANTLLNDPVQRAQYANPFTGSTGGGSGGPRYSTRNDSGSNHFEFSFNTDTGPFGFDDIFGNFKTQRTQRNNDLVTSCEISLEQAYAGCTIELELRTRVGVRFASVTVPPGVDTGTRLRVAGQGERVYGNLPAGDLMVTITVARHDRFERVAQNLVVSAEIDVFDAILGGQVEVMTISGTKIRLDVPAGTQPGQRMRVAGHGMPVLGIRGTHGDLLVAIDVTIPTNLAPEALALLARAKQANTSAS
ncbi:MAG: J domain-containing protein [Verrucomicrobiaceae bacterium]|nr:MAG: J domain-containing protein [Verrucomicrobiaceae bacterium]